MVMRTSMNLPKTSNDAWSTAFKAGLGNNRKVTCKSAPLGTTQEQVFTIGTAFRVADIRGDLKITKGIVNHYGYTHNLTVCTAVDLTKVIAVLRIEGNGNWVEGTVGLPGSGCDFIFPVNPTATNSIAISPNLRIRPPAFIYSGFGPAAPELDADAPKYVVIDDWTGDKFNGEAGRIYFNNRLENWVFTDLEFSEEMGDIHVVGSTNKVTFGKIDFCAVLFAADKSTNAEANVTRYEVLLFQKPVEDNNWKGYPRFSGYVEGTRVLGGKNVKYGVSTTFAPTFKARLCKSDNELVPMKLWDMPRDGLPINSEQLSEVVTKSKPIRLNMNCAQLLYWESHKAKMSKYSKKRFTGMDMRVLRNGMQKEKVRYAGAYLPGYLGDNIPGIEQYFAMPKYAHSCSDESALADPVLDPYLYTEGNPWNTPSWYKAHGIPDSEKGTQGYQQPRNHGLFWEPGGHCGHNQWTGPGGTRVDRGFMPGPLMIYLTNPNWVHMRTGVPMTELIEHWKLGYFNHSCHYFDGDIRDMMTIPFDELLDGKWSIGRAYYNQNTSFTSGGENYCVPQFCKPQGSVTTYADRPHGGLWTDEKGRLPYGGYGADWYHDYGTVGHMALHWLSPSLIYSAKHRYATSLMSALANVGPYSTATEYFANRKHAWKFLNHGIMWKLASEHKQLGVSRDMIMKRVLKECGQVYKEYYEPMWVKNDPSTEMQILKRFGIPTHYSTSSNKWVSDSFGLQFYMGGVLMLMRQLGFFQAVYNSGEMGQKAMLATIWMLDAGSIQWFTQTKGSYMKSVGGGGVFGGPPYIPIDHTTAVNPELPLNWGDWRDRKWALTGQEDWIHNPDGSFGGVDSSEQLKSTWPNIRLHWFRDIECKYGWDEVEEAVDIVNDFHNQWQAKIDKHIADKLPVNSFRLKEWDIPIPYAQIIPPNPSDVEPL